MSARLVLNAFEALLVDNHGTEKVDELLHPPSREDTLAQRAAWLAEAGALG